MSRGRALAGLCAVLLAACSGTDPAAVETEEERPTRTAPVTSPRSSQPPARPARPDGNIAPSPLPHAGVDIGAQAPWVATQSTDPVERWAELAGANLGHARGCGASEQVLADYRRLIEADRVGLEARGLDVSRFDTIVDTHVDRAREDIRRLGQRKGDVDGACAAILERLRTRLASPPR